MRRRSQRALAPRETLCYKSNSTTTETFMATTKPRMMLTLEPQTHAAFKRFAQLSGTPMATIVAQMLDQARPQFEKLGVMLQQARDIESRTKEQQSEFLAKIDVLANRTHAARNEVYTDLVTTVGAKPDGEQRRGGVGRAEQTRAGKAPKSAALSLIHRNKSHKSTPARVPAVTPPKKGGRRASST